MRFSLSGLLASLSAGAGLNISLEGEHFFIQASRDREETVEQLKGKNSSWLSLFFSKHRSSHTTVIGDLESTVEIWKNRVFSAVDNLMLLISFIVGLAFASLLLAMVFSGLKRARELEQRNEEVQRLVRERTDELNKTNVELQSEVSARKLVEDKIRQYNKILQQSNEELEEFGHVVSHDLKEPLRGISLYSGFLLEDYKDILDKDGKDKLHALVDLSKKMESLIESLFHYSCLGAQGMSMQDTDMKSLVEDVLSTLRIKLEESSVEVEIQDHLPVVRCDTLRVSEIYRNLITNAIKYNDKEKKWIRIGSEDLSGQKTFYVEDNGLGIPEKYRKTVFKIFKRLYGAEQYAEGTGSGLALIKKIVERHGGEVWVDDSLSGGSKFRFTLSGHSAE